MQTPGTDISQSIVVVGNSPNILEAEHGETIDQFGTITRVGNFVIEGYEKYVGTRTDYNVTRETKLPHMTIRSRQTINRYLITEDMDHTLGIFALNTMKEMFPDRQIYIVGYTQNLAQHVQQKTKYAGKYYAPQYMQWNGPHNLVKEDLWINRLIAEKRLLVL